MAVKASSKTLNNKLFVDIIFMRVHPIHAHKAKYTLISSKIQRVRFTNAYDCSLV